MLTAITRPTGDELRECELTHIDRLPIDVDRAVAQHADYLATLRSLGVEVVELPRLPKHPDAVFVEDVALVFPEVAMVLRPGAASRLGEMPSMTGVLERFRPCLVMEPPATLDGGDVIIFGRRVLVGTSTRTNPDGLTWLRTKLDPLGYQVDAVPVRGVLHLKSAATVVDDGTFLVNPAAVDLGMLDARLLEVPPHEAHGANVVRVGEHLLADAAAPDTLGILTDHGADIVPVAVDEFTKAEGAISCKGVIFEG